MGFSEETFYKNFDKYLIFEACSRDPAQYLAAMQMPGDLWDFFMKMASVIDIKADIEAKRGSKASAATEADKLGKVPAANRQAAAPPRKPAKGRRK